MGYNDHSHLLRIARPLFANGQYVELGRFIANSAKSELDVFGPQEVEAGVKALVERLPADEVAKTVKLLTGDEKLWPALLQGVTAGLDTALSVQKTNLDHDLVKLFLVAEKHPDLKSKFETVLAQHQKHIAFREAPDKGPPQFLDVWHVAVVFDGHKGEAQAFATTGQISNVAPWNRAGTQRPWVAESSETLHELVSDIADGQVGAPEWVQVLAKGQVRAPDNRSPCNSVAPRLP